MGTWELGNLGNWEIGNSQPFRTKKNQPTCQENKKITQPLRTKNIIKPLGTKKKSPNLSGQKAHPLPEDPHLQERQDPHHLQLPGRHLAPHPSLLPEHGHRGHRPCVISY